MKTKALWIAVAVLSAGTAAPAQRVSWSIAVGRDPAIVVTPAWTYGHTPCPPPRPAVLRPCPPIPPPPPPPSCGYNDYFRRSGVFVYARGPQRVYFPNGYRHSAVLQEWCPVQRAWITIGRAPRGWF